LLSNFAATFGFGRLFCAIIDRVNPVYYAVFSPLEKKQQDEEVLEGKQPQQQQHEPPNKSLHHGKIYYLVESVSQVRAALAQERTMGMEIHFEGVATLEMAQKWLIKHGAFVKGKSENPVPLPAPKEENATVGNDETPGEKRANLKKFKDYYNKQPIYRPMFRSPHPRIQQSRGIIVLFVRKEALRW
jgi:hypothetical protein